MKPIVTTFIALLTSIPAFASYHKGDQATYEKVIYNVHTGRGERLLITHEIINYDSKSKTYTIEESELPLANHSSVTKRTLVKKSNELIETNEALNRIKNCPSTMSESIRYDHGYIPTCRGSNENEMEIIWFANVPFGFAHYEIFDSESHIMTKYMIKNYTKF